MTTDRWRWAQKAHRLRFHQLETARKQAESWRTGLAGLTTLLGAVLIVKGRDNITELARPYQWLVVALLGVALGALIWATLTALRAAHGTPSDQCLLTGEDLEQWTRNEITRIPRAINRAKSLTLAGVGMTAIAVGFTWLSPVADQSGPLLTVESTMGRLCGTLVAAADGTLILAMGPDGAKHRAIPLKTITRMNPARKCSS